MPYHVEWPDAEYHEIIPNLYQGGVLWEENGQYRGGRHSTISGDLSWEYVVSFFLDLDHVSTFPQCDMRLVLFDDIEKGLPNETWDRIRAVVDEIVSRWHRGQKILIRCQAGYNRSGMIMCLVLMRLGFTADSAISLIRERRGASSLINPVFETYVRAREDEYYVASDNVPLIK